jgi:RNA polymerase sigma factor (TIGR02999 family)
MNELTSQQRAALDLLAEEGRDDALTIDRLTPLVYQELRSMARSQLAREDGHPTLQTTAVVHEAYLKLAGSARVTRRGRAYFFAAAARAMRQVLVERARRRGAQRRGGGARSVTLDEETMATDAYAERFVDLDAALEELRARSPRQMRVVECRFFGGLSVDETAEALEVSARTVMYDWSMARAWLQRELGGEEDGP